jgi:K+-sensing histidine kinase KdpD
MRSDLFEAMSQAHSMAEPLSPHGRSVQLTALQHLSALLEDMDWRRRLARGTIATRPARCDIGPVLASLAVDMEARHPESVVVVRCAADLPPARVDPLRLRDVLGMVAEYALQRAPSNAPTLELRAADHARWVLITMQAGLRLRPVVQATLFAPLELLPQALLRAGPGLYVARTLARRLGGDLRVQPGTHGLSALVLAVPRSVPKEARCPMC